jgi:vacuolar protein sorting-associated protein 13B
LVQGIGWGLSALGLSLLGALGGLAHHPLQSLIEDGTVSPRGLAVGLTKGIVGVVAKPISGAADLVAQTGQGLLSATQWSEPFQARRPQLLASNQLDLICSGPTKILWKLNDETPPLTGHHTKASRICCCLEAMRARVNDALPIREQLAPVILLVSTQNFCVLNAEDGEVQVVLDLNEVDCWAHKTDPTLILVRPTPLSAPVLVEARRDDDFNPHYDYQRVSEFVRLTTPYFLPEAAVETVQDVTTNQTSSIATMEFFLNPTTKDFFIQCFQMAKQQRKGVGFALL